MNYAVQLAYKGKEFHGWQIQDNALSVQEALNKALNTILRHPIKTLGSGRTDTGVHAKEQYAMFQSELELNSFQHIKAINALLPNDIVVYGLYKIDEKANVRFDAIERVYEYRVCRRRDPFEKEYSALLLGNIDGDAMNRAAKYLLTLNDFGSFVKSGSLHNTSKCDLRQAQWEFNGHLWTFTIAADRFLRNMVRAIVGTLVELGEGRISLEEFKEICKTGNRSSAGRSMPAEGLFLKEVKYPEGYFQKI